MATENNNRRPATETQQHLASSQDPAEGRRDVPTEDESKQDTKPSKAKFDLDKAYKKNVGTDSNEDPAEGSRDVI
jgi:hypothetical protein